MCLSIGSSKVVGGTALSTEFTKSGEEYNIGICEDHNCDGG